MSLPAFPPAGSQDWYPWAAGVHEAVESTADPDEQLSTLIASDTSATQAAVDARVAALSTLRSRNVLNVKDFGALGNDTDDDAAIVAAVAAAAGGTIYFPTGRYRFSTMIGNNVNVVGDGRSKTILEYTGTGTAIGTSTPGVRVYHRRLFGFTLRTSTGGQIGLDMDSLTQANVSNLEVRGFVTAGAKMHSPVVNGGCLYNVFTDVSFVLCGIGVQILGQSTNENKFYGCRASSCGDGWNITNGNHNVINGCAAETGTRGVVITSTSVANADGNVVTGTRFEDLSGAAWEITSANVRGTLFLGNYRFASTGATIDNGLFTTQIDHMVPRWYVRTNATDVTPYHFERTAGGTEPAFRIRDSISTAGSHVAQQIEIERFGGWFTRFVRGGSTYFEVNGTGDLRQPMGSYQEWTERASDPAAPPADAARLFLKDNGAGKTQLCVRFATGATQVIATEP